MASSKNNANTVPISGGSVGEGIFYIISLWFRYGWCSAILNHNGLLCNIALGWFWAFERWEVAYCNCGVYGASYNVLLERWQKPKTTGALAERWLGGRKKVSDSVPISFLGLFENLHSSIKVKNEEMVLHCIFLPHLYTLCY